MSLTYTRKSYMNEIYRYYFANILSLYMFCDKSFNVTLFCCVDVLLHTRTSIFRISVRSDRNFSCLSILMVANQMDQKWLKPLDVDPQH